MVLDGEDRGLYDPALQVWLKAAEGSWREVKNLLFDLEIAATAVPTACSMRKMELCLHQIIECDDPQLFQKHFQFAGLQAQTASIIALKTTVGGDNALALRTARNRPFGLVGSFGHGGELGVIVSDGCNLMCHDQVCLGIDRCLDIISNKTSTFPTDCHGPRIKSGQRNLAFSCIHQLFCSAGQTMHLSLKQRQFGFQVADFTNTCFVSVPLVNPRISSR